MSGMERREAKRVMSMTYAGSMSFPFGKDRSTQSLRVLARRDQRQH